MLNTQIEIYELKGVIKDLYAPVINGKMLIDNHQTAFKSTYYGHSVEEVTEYCNTENIIITNRDLIEDEEDKKVYTLVKTIEVA